jgi:phosphoglycerol transferase MdoB-like AlkP superfamily enzyme
MFLYNGNLAWDNMEGFFRKQGIDRFVGSPDYEHPIHRDRVWGVTDQDVFDRANREFEEADAKGPFFSLVLTLSNHVPFDLPEPLPFARTTEMGELNRRIDGIRYADWAVGHFIAEAKTLKYFQNTLFVFVGDHGFHVAPKLTEAHLLFHHVPLLFYSPLLSDKGKVISTAAAQMNILPTILGLLGVQPAQASWGRNLFSKEFADENFVVFKGSGGSGSDQAMVMIRGDKLMVVGSEGTPSIWKYRLNPTPSIEPLTDPASIVLRDRMQLEINAYVQSAMSDLTSQHGGGRTPVIQPVELLHEREDNDRDVPATRPAS